MNELWQSFKLGFLDDVFTVFDDHTHPVVMVGDQALRWMAVDLVTNQVCLGFRACFLRFSTGQ
jgi:hypothetical protein